MLKNYKPYGELDLTEDGYVFDITDVELASIVSAIGTYDNYALKSATTIASQEVKSTLDLTKLYEQVGCDKYKIITVTAKIGSIIKYLSLYRNGKNGYHATLPMDSTTIFHFELHNGAPYTYIKFAAVAMS